MGTLDHVPVRSLSVLTDSAGGTKNDKDIILMEDFAHMHAFFFVCSRGQSSFGRRTLFASRECCRMAVRTGPAVLHGALQRRCVANSIDAAGTACPCIPDVDRVHMHDGRHCNRTLPMHHDVITGQDGPAQCGSS